ncbi:MAG: acetate/propionate family kinase [Mesorhizobium sp.]|uniref:acetate/propionate family kinase n=1 Tax=unclassified Mesorhizobium TaxID=325217 RepID=UPI000FCC41BC|nr:MULTISPECIES: acetate/propionate family kinase [unclassified Mesorhizobium]RUV74807.1 acetate/propionate family kinase [Mesorhizobium sp. M5C.F.Cr.IN.023.01.1.1]RWF88685.1 MAG: acetate/propionate family kinase [Mesorhizobium sp.]RWF92923.1 MAG: acetate/propionate family kinase [Mesorhizobium sp.]RWI41246.1 MAG: acetate/propionate family kinase [Mesorhizobium sp.]RWI49762.1 MAG: acetate/propionate family kinase [Mesorhizobium sp.]
MPDIVLVLNAGSSSTKFGLYEVDLGYPQLLSRGILDLGDRRLSAKAADGSVLVDRELVADQQDYAGFGALLGWLDERAGVGGLVAVGHRIVHGGRSFDEPVLLTQSNIETVREITPLAPLHQPRTLVGVDAIARLRPGLPQIGCFDTAFHKSLDATVSRIALPRNYEAEGVRRYGFHGLSYEYIATRLRDISPELARKRTVVAHLGNGASLCAMRDGKSVDTTMGFSALDGLVMGTRPGGTDPGVLLYLLMQKNMSPAELEDLLYHKSGLLGVSGVSAEMRALITDTGDAAREAVELFVFRAARETAALANTLEGLECLVFTAGIGEHSAPVRSAICDKLRWLGVELDAAANQIHADVVSSKDSAVEVRVIPTDEEMVIARHILAVKRFTMASI